MKIGVLALQGAVSEHMDMLHDCGVEGVRVKKKADFPGLRGLIIPGGESTTIGRLIENLGLTEPIAKMKEEGLPLFGTCAGLVLLGKEAQDLPEQKLLCHMDTTVVRNGFGRQRESFEADLTIASLGQIPFRGVFIRAPYISRVGGGVEVLLTHQDRIIAARQENVFVAAFHPELTQDNRMHRFFLEMVPS